jgi:hypothetical protein
VHGGPLVLDTPTIAASNGAIHPDLVQALKEVAAIR